MEAIEGGAVKHDAPAVPQVDPFLIELLENPRYRLIVLRMEMDIQKFIENPNSQEFEFQHFPTSYLRCAAHRVAQHYGLETSVADNILNNTRVLARKTPTSKFPILPLSKIPPKQPEREADEKVKLVIRQRPKGRLGESGSSEGRRNMVKSFEEREEEYDKARARIFNGSASNFEEKNVEEKVVVSVAPPVQSFVQESERNSNNKVALFRDREKDLNDPDYDRSYQRYVRSGPMPVQNFEMVNSVVPQFMPYLGNQIPVPAFQNPGNGFYVPWPSPAMMYAHCYGNLTHAVSQVPFYQGFDQPHYG